MGWRGLSGDAGHGLIPAAPAHAFRPEGSGSGETVFDPWAGLAGMSAAYELGKLGYRCTILEARERAGGRCWSIRKGSTNVETGARCMRRVLTKGSTLMRVLRVYRIITD